jgi:hypothetical protein
MVWQMKTSKENRRTYQMGKYKVQVKVELIECNSMMPKIII